MKTIISTSEIIKHSKKYFNSRITTLQNQFQNVNQVIKTVKRENDALKIELDRERNDKSLQEKVQYFKIIELASNRINRQAKWHNQTIKKLSFGSKTETDWINFFTEQDTIRYDFNGFAVCLNLIIKEKSFII